MITQCPRLQWSFISSAIRPPAGLIEDGVDSRAVAIRTKPNRRHRAVGPGNPELVSLIGIELDVGVAVLLFPPDAGLSHGGLGRRAEPLVDDIRDLLAVDRMGHGDAEVLLQEQLPQVLVLVGVVEEGGADVAAGIVLHHHPVATLFLVFLEDGVVLDVLDAAGLKVGITGHGLEEDGLSIGQEGALDAVDVRKLIAGRVHLVVVGVALPDLHRGIHPIGGDPGHDVGGAGVVGEGGLGGKQVRPQIEALFGHLGLKLP